MLEDDQVYTALERVSKSGFLNAPVDDLVTVAVAMWHEGFVPHHAWVKKLDQRSLLVVGYLAEFLAGFNVLCSEERNHLLQFAEKLRPAHPPSVKPDEYRDELATQWGLEYDLAPYFEHLSHYQTRHYQHESAYKRPSKNFVL